VQEVFVPAIFHQFGNDHDDAPVRMFLGEFENVLNDGDDDEAVRRRQSGELGRFDAGGAEGLLDVAIPILLQEFGMLAGLDVNGDDFR
jgi:hypothetical protein